ncbi:MAG: hypothetical protein WAU23_14260 [Ferruginibacter sp.]
MKQVLLVSCILFALGNAKAQSLIKLAEVDRHIGDSVTVCGKVESMRYFENGKGKPTLLNIGAAFPNQLLTVLIWDETRSLFPGKLEDLLKKEICITGRIILYKEKPEIIINKTEQLVVQ